MHFQYNRGESLIDSRFITIKVRDTKLALFGRQAHKFCRKRPLAREHCGLTLLLRKQAAALWQEKKQMSAVKNTFVFLCLIIVKISCAMITSGAF